jgi:hypothetical protein
MSPTRYVHDEDTLDSKFNGHKIDFYSGSLEYDQNSESIIPEPMSLEKIVPESLPISPPNKNIDSMFNMLVSEQQSDRDAFTYDYLQRKIDRRLKEIGHNSSEKNQDYIQDARVVLENNLHNTQSNKGYYNIHFASNPDPSYLRNKANIMADTE